MNPHPAFKTAKRICAICGKALRKNKAGQYETTYGFHTQLQRMGIPWPADKAHPTCVKEYGRVAVRVCK